MIYLDYAATSPLLSEAKKAMSDAADRLYGNASALHTPGHLAMNAISHAREQIAKLLNCSPEEIIFTSCASESNNTVVRTFEGHQIETSPLEHHSILETAQLFSGPKLPKLYSYMLANNETGEFLALPHIDRQPYPDKNPASDKSSSSGKKSSSNPKSSDLRNPTGIPLFDVYDNWGHPLVTDRRHTYLHSDLTQVIGKIPVDVQKLGLDYATLSAHKIGGPLGVGALYVRKGVPFKPLIIGGGQENHRRGGTYNTIGIVGFGTAVEYVLKTRPWEAYDTKVRHLRDTLAERILQEIPGSSLNTDLDSKKSLPNILNASFKAAEGESIQLYLDAEGIIVSTGSACASGDTKPSHVLMAKTGGDAEVAHSSIRFSFSPDNTQKDVDAVMKVLPGIVERLQQISTI